MKKRVTLDSVTGTVVIDANPEDIERTWSDLRKEIRRKLRAGETLTAIERDRLLGLMARRMGIL